ncbi:MAG: glycosyltransferase family 39 protein [Saprospiraceae bacterium]|nr:glycosyltransferase family 39 protein [Saprospiraceae bacterium]
MKHDKSFFGGTTIILIAICVGLGILLRIGNPFDICFINDELSTWSKISFNSLSEVINNIKTDDSHPVGLYVFLYFWTGIFGTSVFAIKLPFFLMSIACMFLVYRIGSIWFSSTVGLFLLAYFCSLQYPIWWSTIARQYQSGLFCTLIMVYFWTLIFFKKSENNWCWVGFVLAGAASMYNHYFSLLFAGLLWVSGLVWLRKELVLKYLLAGIIMGILFLPHLGITNYQLLYADGHKWYECPTPHFISNHLFYLFHYSFWSSGLILLLFLGSIIKYWRVTVKTKLKIRLTAVYLFLTPLLFGYFYSVYYSPILRESHLLFSFPYLLIFLLSFFPDKTPKNAKVAIVLAVLIVNIFTLVYTRSHFQVVNAHPYKHFIAKTKNFLKIHKPKDVTIVLGENPIYLQYYKEALNAEFNHIESFKPDISFKVFREILQKQKTPYLIVGSLPEAHIRMAMDFYPGIYLKDFGINYEYYILARDSEIKEDSIIIDYQTTLNFNYGRGVKGWSFEPYKVLQDSINGNFFFKMSGEWGPTFNMDLSKITPRANQFLDVSVDVRAVDSVAIQPQGVLVLEIYNEQDTFWKGVEIHQQTTINADWQRVYLSLRFAHESFYKNFKNYKMKTFFWNRENQLIHLDRFTISSRKGNPILYGDTENMNN